MNDKKLTDKEIVKALKEILELMLCEGDLQRSATISNALDLINRLQEKDKTRHKVFETKCEELEIAKAENERLKEEICIQHKIIDERGAEVLRHDRCIRTLHEKLETAKAEAYKEFVERLIEKYGYYDWENKTIVYPEDEINNLLKELVGEDNG